MKHFLILGFIMGLVHSGPSQAGQLHDQLVKECHERIEAQEPKELETTCHNYGSQTKCTSKERSAGGYSPTGAYLQGQKCSQEAIDKAKIIRDHILDSSNPYMATIYQNAGQAPIGQKIYWEDNANSAKGFIVALKEGDSDKGRICRYYNISWSLFNELYDDTKITCQTSMGGWEIVE